MKRRYLDCNCGFLKIRWPDSFSKFIFAVCNVCYNAWEWFDTNL